MSADGQAFMSAQSKLGKDAASVVRFAHELADRRSHRSPIGRTPPSAAMHAHDGMMYT